MKRLGKGRFRFLRGQRGISLLETVLALAILGLIGVGVLTALDTNAKATRQLDEQVVAANLAATHLEAIKECPYADTYPNGSCPLDSIVIPPQYSVAINTYGSDDGTTWSAPCDGETLQMITVSVSRPGKHVLSMCTYRTKR